MRYFKKDFFILFIILNFPTCKVLAGNDFLIIANGPFEEEIVRKYLPTKKLIALDGAAKQLYQRKITPDYILGDFDSLPEVCESDKCNYFNFTVANKYFQSLSTPQDELLFEEHNLGYEKTWEDSKDSVTYIRAASQNYTDLEKGIKFCISKGANNIIVTGALGGERTDHSLGNLSILKRYHENSYKLQIETKKEIIEFLKDETTTFQGSKEAKFGLFGFPKASAVSKGLVWDMDNYPLDLGMSESSCNILKDTEVMVTVQGEAIMIRPNY